MSNLTTKHLLLILNPVDAGLLQRHFTAQGYSVQCMPSIRKAIKYTQKNPTPDLIISEFFQIYFHDRVSELEALLAARDLHFPTCKACVLALRQQHSKVEQMRLRYAVDEVMYVPFKSQQLIQTVETLMLIND